MSDTPKPKLPSSKSAYIDDRCAAARAGDLRQLCNATARGARRQETGLG